MSSFLQVESVTKCFENGMGVTPVLHGIDLKLERGESLAIIGGSGAGKSTLLHIIGTLESPTTGKIVFDGEDVSGWADKELAGFRNKNLGFVFQFHYLLNEFSAIDNVALPAIISGQSKAESVQKAAELLGKLGMSHRETYFPNSLSGGEQQRLAIARALIMNPGLVLADEPTGNLDKTNSGIIQDLFLKVVEDFKVGLITVTHDEKFASAFGRTKRMREGLWA